MAADIISDSRQRLYDAAKNVMEDAGMDFRAPWDCSLDDGERARYEALSAVIDEVLARCMRIAEDQARSLRNGGAINACRAVANAIEELRV